MSALTTQLTVRVYNVLQAARHTHQAIALARKHSHALHGAFLPRILLTHAYFAISSNVELFCCSTGASSAHAAFGLRLGNPGQHLATGAARAYQPLPDSHFHPPTHACPAPCLPSMALARTCRLLTCVLHRQGALAASPRDAGALGH